jgi:hypothetical protein
MIGQVTKFEAVVSLVGGELSQPLDGIIRYHSGQTPPSASEIDTEVIRLQTEYDALQFQRDRTYPSIGDQLDMQYHDQVNGTTTWKDAIAKVKSDNPKPE